MKTLLALALLLPLAPLSAVTLAEVDFSGGPGAVGTITSSDSQFTLSSLVSSGSLTAVGGSAGTAGWVYDGTGTAAANTDLHVASTFGGPTRFDLDLGTAASGQSYSITSVEIDVRASNSAGTTFQFGYRDLTSTTQLIGAVSIATQSGTDPISTYSIDLSSEGLSATDSAVNWTTGGTGNLRFFFYEPTGTGNDNLQIDAIRVIGIPEPSSALLIALGGALLGVRRRNG